DAATQSSPTVMPSPLPTQALPGQTAVSTPTALSPNPTELPTPVPTEPASPVPADTSPPGTAASLPDPANYTWDLVAGGLNSPVGMAVPADGSGRLFVLEQAGVIRIVQDGQVLATPFLDIVDQVGSGANEQGLLGLAFHPVYSENGYFYINYTDRNGDTVIARFSVSDDPNRADRDSQLGLLGVDQPFANHNGGVVAFGPDGYLYLGLGDGGSGGDPQGNAQSLDTLLGKILRLDVDAGDSYGIPPDNPFADAGGRPEIWAYGLRNPWRFSFDHLNGDLYIGDVGQNAWEEIDFLPAGHPGGANFGWDYREGAHPFEGTPPAGLELIDPVVEYSLSGANCAVTGGYVYRGQNLPDFHGVYLYGDFCSGVVWGLLRLPDGSWQNAALFETGANITSFGQDEAGEIYLVDRQGSIYHLAQR
ncbi:MAG TPA: PQQ-dependent sugar dehydrogenase, partial [Anaerolineales bacterium]